MVAKLPSEFKMDRKGIEARTLGFSLPDSNGERPYLALKYFDSTHQCFCEWEKSELKAFSELNHKLRKQTWQDILQTGGKRNKGNKTGIGYTGRLDPDDVPDFPDKDKSVKMLALLK